MGPHEKPDPPQHDEVEQYSSSVSGPEPASSDFNISVSIPETIEIRMVDATSLSDYEIWFFGSGALLSLVTGFTVASVQESNASASKVLATAAGVFGLLFLACFAMTLVKRHILRKKGKTVRLKTSRIAKEK